MLMNKIFLIGMMGCGKTTVGKELAQVLGYTFIDSDSEIEKKSKMKISQIFLKYGEPYFRKLETDFLDSLPENKIVVACGGGLPCFNDNINRIKRLGFVIYLEAAPELLFLRVAKLKDRPLISDLKQFKVLFNQRSGDYQAADLVIDASLTTKEILVQILLKTDSKIEK